jgi:hypothetical protein
MKITPIIAATFFATTASAGGLAPPIVAPVITQEPVETCWRLFVGWTTNCEVKPRTIPDNDDDDNDRPRPPTTPPTDHPEDPPEEYEDDEDGPKNGCNGRFCAPDSGGGNSEGNENSDQDND